MARHPRRFLLATTCAAVVAGCKGTAPLPLTPPAPIAEPTWTPPVKPKAPLVTPAPAAPKAVPAPTLITTGEREPTPLSDPYGDYVRCPQEMTLVDDTVCIDKWEASLAVKNANGDLVALTPYEAPSPRMKIVAVSKANVIPQGFISGEAAEAACVGAGKRLCNEEEWELACRGPENTQFPYGPDREEGACNDDGRKTHPVAEAARRAGIPREEMWSKAMSLPILNRLRDTIDRTGANKRCTNGYATFDMVGNLHEWVTDPDGTFRGGFYMDTRINGDGCSYRTTAHPKSYYDYSTGFRCCADPDAPGDAEKS